MLLYIAIVHLVNCRGMRYPSGVMGRGTTGVRCRLAC